MSGTWRDYRFGLRISHLPYCVIWRSEEVRLRKIPTPPVGHAAGAGWKDGIRISKLFEWKAVPIGKERSDGRGQQSPGRNCHDLYGLLARDEPNLSGAGRGGSIDLGRSQ